jgi:hypothetical protein
MALLCDYNDHSLFDRALISHNFPLYPCLTSYSPSIYYRRLGWPLAAAPVTIINTIKAKMPFLWGHISFECHCLMNVHVLNNKFFGRIWDVQWVRNWTLLWPFMPSVARVPGGPGSNHGTTRKKRSGSGTGSTQPRDYNWGATSYKSSGFCLENREYGCRDPSR